jgi:superfamily II DNA or RNA helicase
LVGSLNVDLRWRDERNAGYGIKARSLGALTKEQETAVTALLLHDTGVLAATTGFGKTVLTAAVIAARKVSTLILVHRHQLLEQWAARLQSFLNLPEDSIGQIGGGVRKPTGVIDIAMIQSLAHGGVVDDLVAEYGQLIVDECRHLSAVSFEAVARRAKAKFVLGFSATVPARTVVTQSSSCNVARYASASMRGPRPQSAPRSSSRAAQNVLRASAGD